MTPRGIQASFYRGGTSRGLIFRAETLAPYAPKARDEIIRTALGSPDPGGRQISGLGGGVSSLSKACIIGVPGEGIEAQDVYGKLPGVTWADDSGKRGEAMGEWDIVYRFAQVGVKDTTMDWEATCGNMLSAVALAAVSTPLIPYTTLFSRAKSLPTPQIGEPLLFPLTILSASNGLLMKAKVPIDQHTLQVHFPQEGDGCIIAGVPGEDLGIEIEMPIETGEEVEGGLVTGNPSDTFTLESGKEITISILSAGLPNIFVSLSALDLPNILITASSSELTSHPTLSSLLESVRVGAAKKFSIPISLASPKITLFSSFSSDVTSYRATSGVIVKGEDADLIVRAVSSGDFHATIPGTTLGALNIGLGTPGTVIHDLVHESRTSRELDDSTEELEEVVTVRAAHAAGVATASVKFITKSDSRTGKQIRLPESVVMMRTAREIMRGEIMIPERIFAREYL